MRIITVTGYKGGTGKSTTAYHLAVFFSNFGVTLLIDSDPNRTALKWAGRSRVALPFRVVDERQATRVVAGNDYVIIDTPARPDSDDLKELARGCDLLILPTSPDIVSLEPMLDMVGDLGGANFRALVTIVPPRPSRDGELMMAELAEGGVPVFRTTIRRTRGFTRAAEEGVPVRDLGEKRLRAAWDDYRALGEEVKELLDEPEQKQGKHQRSDKSSQKTRKPASQK